MAKPPGNTSHLQRLAKDGAVHAGVPQGRYQRWLNTVLLSAVLDGSRDGDGDQLFALKGGAAMELRLGVAARASKDYDAAFRERGREIDHAASQPLDPVRLAGPGYIACVSVRYQIAQKIHACTEVYDDGSPNDRFRDLIDLELLRELVPDEEMPAVRRGCVEIFELRDKHAWPPEVRVWPDWSDGFRAMAADVAFFTDDVEQAAEGLRTFIAGIDAAE